MALRNFWVEGKIDGRKTTIQGGPRSKDGGMRLDLYQLNDREKKHVLGVNSYVRSDGKLVTEIYHKGRCIAEEITER